MSDFDPTGYMRLVYLLHKLNIIGFKRRSVTMTATLTGHRIPKSWIPLAIVSLMQEFIEPCSVEHGDVKA